MPSQAQYLELSEVLNAAQSWWRERDADNDRALGKAIELALQWLRPWLKHEIGERLIGGTDNDERRARIDDLAEEMLAEAAYKAVKDFAKLDSPTGKGFYRWMQKVADCRLRDLERGRRRRRRRGTETVSLDGDAAARKLAALLEDDLPSPEAVALLKELKSELRRAKKHLTAEQRLVVALVRDGTRLAQIAEKLGRRALGDWRAAKAHIRRVLEGRRPPRKPK